MIIIDTTAAGIQITRGELTIQIAAAAVPGTLGLIIVALTDNGKELARARRSGYEDGLTQGYINAEIARATRDRIADRQERELTDMLVGVPHASAA